VKPAVLHRRRFEGYERFEQPRAHPHGRAEVFKIAEHARKLIDEVEANHIRNPRSTGWCPGYPDHQGRGRKLDLPMERVIVTVQEHGNTSAASVPLALDAGVRDGRIKPGDLVLLEAFGGGLTWGAALVRM
jgi:3-oxoacyl-[acyl-carrier-protein] synthase-3